MEVIEAMQDGGDSIGRAAQECSFLVKGFTSVKFAHCPKEKATLRPIHWLVMRRDLIQLFSMRICLIFFISYLANNVSLINNQ
jgi:hypothetical protein